MARFVHAFDRFYIVDTGDYNPHMRSKPEIGKHSRREVFLEDKKACSFLVSTTNRSSRLFILFVVKETWVSKIEGADTYFKSVSEKALLNHLVDNCDGLDNIDAVDIRLYMLSWWGKSPGVPEFILWVEKGQKKADRSNIPIEDAHMSTISAHLIRMNQDLPIDRELWDKLPVTKRTWKAWKKAFLDAHQAAQQTQKANNYRGVSFISVNASTQLHQHQLPTDILPAVKAYMENIDTSLTTNHAMLESLVVSNVCLSVTTEKKRAMIESLWKYNVTLR